MIFTTYQVQGWRTMVLYPVETQPVGSNVKGTADFSKK